MLKTDLNLEDFVRGYLTCALFASSDDNDEPLDTNYDADDFAEEALARANTDCIDFIAANSARLLKTSGTSDQHGIDFWFTRNGHGVGFWDRDYGKVGEVLSNACSKIGELNVEVGDDGRLYFL